MPDPSKESQSKELAALDAIIAASLAGQSFESLTDEEIIKMSEGFAPLSDEGREIFKGLNSSLFSQPKAHEHSETPKVLEEDFAGMYRQGSDDDLPPKLKQEIDKKRAEILARLKAKREGDV